MIATEASQKGHSVVKPPSSTCCKDRLGSMLSKTYAVPIGPNVFQSPTQALATARSPSSAICQQNSIASVLPEDKIHSDTQLCRLRRSTWAAPAVFSALEPAIMVSPLNTNRGRIRHRCRLSRPASPNSKGRGLCSCGHRAGDESLRQSHSISE